MTATRLSRAGAVAVAATAVAAYAWYTTSVRTFSWQARLLVSVPAVATLVWSWQRGEPRPRVRDWWRRVRSGGVRSTPLAGVALWLVLVAVLLAWELVAFFEPTHTGHPTVSSVGDELLRVHAIRFGAFLGWLALGWWLGRR